MATFLIADDSREKIMLMQHMLMKNNWDGETLIAMTTEDAKGLIDKHTINFAFIDFYIPSDNGPAVITYLQEKHPAARIALVSSADNRKNFDEAQKAGAEACICTTFEMDTVEGAFSELLKDWIRA